MLEKKKLTKSNIYMIACICILVLAVAGSAYAYYSASATGEIVGEAAGAGLNLTIEKLSDTNGALIPLDNTPDMLTKAAKGYGNNGSTFDKTKSCIDKNGYTVCQVYRITLSNTGTVPITVNGGVTLSGTNTPNIECSKMASSTSVTDNTSCKGSNTLANNYTLNAGSSSEYYIIVYINNLNTEQEDVGLFNGEVTFTSTTGAKLKAKFFDTAVDKITKLYKDATKTVVTNNNIKYNYATSVNLMNDRLGGTTSDYDAGNIRYYGASPSNYIDIGDRDGSDNVILYRIIGVFKDITLSDGSKEDLIKVVRNENIGQYSWDTSSSTVNGGSGINEWSQADAMKLLNPGYENNKDLDRYGNEITVNNSLWWNSQSGTCYRGFGNSTTTCNFTSIGLSDNAKSKIATVLWNTGGFSSSKIYSNQAYIYERGNAVIQNPSDGITRNTTWIGKVALMYPSDYGYSIDFNNYSETLFNYNNSNSWLCRTYNEEWFITPVSSDGVNSFSISYNGKVSDYSSVNAATQMAMFLAPEPIEGGTWTYYELRPTFYLNSDVYIIDGIGTYSNPYILS